MEITEIRITRMIDTGNLKATASVTFDDVFVVHDIKVIDGKEGMFIAMPSRKLSDNKFADIAHPLNTELRNRLKEAVLNKYYQLD